MNHINEAIKSYYSDEVEEMKQKAKKALKISMLSGIFAVITFGFIIFCIFSSIIFEINPLENPTFLILIIVSIPIVFISIPTSWFMTARVMYLNKKIRAKVDDDLRKKVIENP